MDLNHQLFRVPGLSLGYHSEEQSHLSLLGSDHPVTDSGGVFTLKYISQISLLLHHSL